jgi:hypothetical protein
VIWVSMARQKAGHSVEEKVPVKAVSDLNFSRPWLSLL